jgi:hypothetical protein
MLMTMSEYFFPFNKDLQEQHLLALFRTNFLKRLHVLKEDIPINHVPEPHQNGDLKTCRSTEKPRLKDTLERERERGYI